MVKDQDLERILADEFSHLMPILVLPNEAGEYLAFGRYRIVPQHPGYRVYINEDEQGFFSTTRTALSWCIADKYHRFNLASDLKYIDSMLYNLSNDIFVRVGIANKTRNSQLRENIETKLEPKIIQRRELEQQLAKCVNSAKYLQQKGFLNETQRFGTATNNKTNRSSI